MPLGLFLSLVLLILCVISFISSDYTIVFIMPVLMFSAPDVTVCVVAGSVSISGLLLVRSHVFLLFCVSGNLCLMSFILNLTLLGAGCRYIPVSSAETWFWT